MINLRYVGDRYYIGGNWENVPKDLMYLSYINVKAVLDLNPPSSDSSINFIQEEAHDIGIRYVDLVLQDYEGYADYDLDRIFDTGHEILDEMEEAYPRKRDRLLIKSATGISRAPAMFIYHNCINKRTTYLEELIALREQEMEEGVTFGASPSLRLSAYFSLRFPESHI